MVTPEALMVVDEINLYGSDDPAIGWGYLVRMADGTLIGHDLLPGRSATTALWCGLREISEREPLSLHESATVEVHHEFPDGLKVSVVRLAAPWRPFEALAWTATTEREEIRE